MKRKKEWSADTVYVLKLVYEASRKHIIIELTVSAPPPNMSVESHFIMFSSSGVIVFICK
jgi:hypothetical protein